MHIPLFLFTTILLNTRQTVSLNSAKQYLFFLVYSFSRELSADTAFVSVHVSTEVDPYKYCALIT